MANFLTKLFGTKSDRDLKQLVPIKDLVLEAYETIKNLSNDELRGKTDEFKQLIHEAVKDDEARIAEIKKELDENYGMEISEKEKLYKIKVERLSSKIKWFVNGELFLEYSDETPLKVSDGFSKLSFANWKSDVEFDDLKIYALEEK